MRQNVTYEEIVTAAEAIIANGANPTIEKIRISLGSRGSNSTISKYLNDWRKTISHKEYYINPCVPLNENFEVVQNKTKEYSNDVENTKREIIRLQNELSKLKTKHEANQQEYMLTKNDLTNALKYHVAWQEEKDKYIEDLKQAHKITLTVLKEHYQDDMKQLGQKLNSALRKMDEYIKIEA